MSFRTVVIANRCKLDLHMNYLEVRREETKKILLDDIETLIIEDPAVSLTGCLMSALVEKKIKVIFCDAKRNPQYELAPYYGSHDCARKVRNQICWPEDVKGQIWTMLVSEKITKQADLLEEIGKSGEERLLRSYVEQMTYRDETNREGHAAKVYFNALFGMDFTRNEDNATNAALNYGYALILSAFNREVVANGYLTQLGFFHDNMFNQFNLSCDLMEPFRILVDRMVYQAHFTVFRSEQKHEMIKIFSSEIHINNSRQTVSNGIKIYTKSIFDAMEERDLSYVAFYGL